ncbi:MAG: efflux RND transporter permease subunit [Opitutaceae bacterium]|nr:efflux RND transporter permease subunit [Opitutaceae bacterium]
MTPGAPHQGMAGRLAAFFINSKLTPVAVIASLLLGLFAVWMLPREEEPQIEVPMIDVLATLPGASPAEVESRLTRPLEQLLWEVPGVEYLYATSSPGHAMIIARFLVGTDIETALVRLNRRLDANRDRLPPGVGLPLVKPRTIDDVPVLALTLHSRAHDHLTLRRLALQLEEAVKSVPQVAETTVIGGVPRQIRVQIDPAALADRGLTALQVAGALRSANHQLQHGSRPFANEEILLETDGFLRDATEVGAVVVGVHRDRPVYLREVAAIRDGGAEPADYVLFGAGRTGDLEPAVTLSLAKRPGANAVDVVNAVLAKVDTFKGALLPADVGVTVTRDYGHTAAEKSNELLVHMGIAVFGVTLLILLFLGWRESLVVLLAIPSTLALTLLVFYLHGYTLNRITLFALIFSIGILVDDAIVVVENIVRHARLPGARAKPFTQIALAAVAEVGNPTILATWAVLAAILPMAFVGGLMGPYMRPIPVGATAAMLFSLLIAFSVTPWAALRVLRRRFGGGSAQPTAAPEVSAASAHDTPDDWFTRLYHRVMEPLLDHARWRWAFLGGIVGLLLLALGLVLSGAVVIKMLPFDNKSEFQIILTPPEGTTLEQTARIAAEMADATRAVPEVRDLQVYAGTAAPFNFNGLVRHYFARRGPNVADIQVNLVPKEDRAAQSHAVANRVRALVAPIAARHGAVVIVAEVPPGPPVLQSLVAEIYGPDETRRVALARRIKAIFAQTPGVVDLDWYVEEQQPKVRYVVDQTKAALHGVSTDTITRTLQLATTGLPVGLLHLDPEREPVAIQLELPPAARPTPAAPLDLVVRADLDPASPLVPLSELVRLETTRGDRFLYRKNLQPVTYVTADVAGAVESPAYALFAINRAIAKIDAREFGAPVARLPVFHLNLPADDLAPALKWDGEWHITLEVFRDLGLAFAAVIVLITMLMVGWFRSYLTPLVVMSAIPFSLIGILPAHWAFGAFFTATSMIGFMAGAGIVVRNSIILVDFIELRLAEGLNLRDAVVEAGAVRFRPMLLTALALIAGAAVILRDPIFQGLAISLMFGEIASLLISRMAVPVLYYMAKRRHPSTA